MREIGVFAEIPFPTYFLPAAAALRAKHVQRLALQTQRVMPLSGVSSAGANKPAPSLESSDDMDYSDLPALIPLTAAHPGPSTSAVWPEAAPPVPVQPSILSMFPGVALGSESGPNQFSLAPAYMQPPVEPPLAGSLTSGPGVDMASAFERLPIGENGPTLTSDLFLEETEDEQYQADIERAIALSMEGGNS